MSLTKYDSYKDSGVDYIGTIPSTWKVTRNKYITTIKGRIGFKGYTKNDFVKKEDGALVIGATEMNYNGSISIQNSQYVSWFKYYESPEIMLSIGQILIVQRGSTVGKVAYISKDLGKATINPSLVLLKEIKINNQYLMYYLMSSTLQGYIKSETATTAIPMITQAQIGNYFILIPPRQEQQQIANYLDQQTKTIDKKISLLEAKIEHYQALKKSLINEMVCRGLDKTVTLKDSGIEWIGAIPEHWEVKRLKDLGFLYSGLSGKKGADFNQENNPNNRGFIPFTNIANNTYLDKNHLGVVEVKENENQNQVQKHDLFFLMSSEGYEDLGKSALLVDNVGEVYLNSFCKGFRLTDNNIHSYYLNYLLLSDSYRNTMMIEGKGFTRINLKMNKINDFIIAVPPLQEQQQIAKYLDEKTGIIDQIIANIQSQVERLQELRKSLINEVVTGKVRVPEMECVK